jgi:glutaminyl-peptide cyclotransferase
MVKKVALGIYSIILLLLASCEPDANTTTQTDTKQVEPKPVTKSRVKAPVFNEDSAFAYLKKQVGFGPRIPGSKSHQKTAEWLQAEFKKRGATVYAQNGTGKTFDGKQHAIKNIIASFNDSALDRIIVCAHWDCRPFADKDSINQNKAIDGANDAASGVSVILEIARVLSQNKPDIGVDLILFDLEDYGRGEVRGFDNNDDSWCLGSKYWAQNKHKAGYNARYGILLDMVGGKNPSFPKEGYSVQFVPSIVNKVWSSAQNLGYSNVFKDQVFGPIMDDHYYVNEMAGIPCIDILNYDFTINDFMPHHHKNSDNISNIDKTTLKMVGSVILDVLYNE